MSETPGERQSGVESPERPLYLRCQYIGAVNSSSVRDSPNHAHEAESWTDKCIQQPFLAHWQLECDGQIYEIKRTEQSWVSLIATSYLGLFIGNLRWLPCDEPELRFTPRALNEDDVAFYREEIGMTSLRDADITAIGKWPFPDLRLKTTAAEISLAGENTVVSGPYHLLWRNCQTTMKEFAEKIITAHKEPRFIWPYHSSHFGYVLIPFQAHQWAKCKGYTPWTWRR
ncbi:hypothetical protein N0V82_004511 [Gnomoniopsis sp. IMI 355080]|nr:hypothetical protein N0V82_004511 [Gnomoniopsis sp. IMI 355080]